MKRPLTFLAGLALAVGVAHAMPIPFFSGGATAGAGAIWAWRSSDASLAPYIGTGTPAATRANNTATIINSSGLVETVNANTARFDYTLARSDDTSGFGRHCYSMGPNAPSAVGAPLAGVELDGVDNDWLSQGLNCGASGFGVSDADGSMEVQATIRRTRAGVADFVVSVARRDGISFNWALYVTAGDKAAFGMRNSAGTFVESVGTTSLGTGTTYTIKGRWTGTELIVSVGGVDEGTPTALTALTAHDGTAMTIGRSTWDTSDATSPHPFQGIIASVSMTRGAVVQGNWPLTSIARVPGLLSEPAATNISLHNRDLTQAAWVKGATATVAKDQTGVDGAANGASRITGGAVAATNTALQTVVLASSSRAFSAYIKRLTGTGQVDMTTDNGTTWVNITSKLSTTDYKRIALPPQTVTNPVFGFRVQVNSDAIAVDYIQNETGKMTSPVSVGASAVTRPADVITLATSSIGNFSNTTLSVYSLTVSAPGAVLAGEFPMAWGLFTDNSNYIASFRNDSATNNKRLADVVNGGASQASLTLGPDDGNQPAKATLAVAANDVAGIAGGNSVQTDATATVPTVSTLQIGGFNSIASEYWRGWIFELEIYNQRRPNDTMTNKVSWLEPANDPLFEQRLVA